MTIHNPYDDADLLADVAAVQVVVDAIQVVVDDIQAVTDAIPTLTETGGTLTADGTEQDVYINNAPAGVYRPICVKVDCTAHTATETIVLKVYYRIATGGNMILQDEAEYVGLIDPQLINIELEPNRYGVQVTLEKTAGTNRAYPWEVSYEA